MRVAVGGQCHVFMSEVFWCENGEVNGFVPAALRLGRSLALPFSDRSDGRIGNPSYGGGHVPGGTSWDIRCPNGDER